MAFATVPVSDLVAEAGEPRRRRSSDFGERWFCGACGSPVAMRVDREPETIDVAIASLDEPATVRPGFHIWWESRVEGFDVRDDLPRFARGRSGENPAPAGPPGPAQDPAQP